MVEYRIKRPGIWSVIQGDDCPLGHRAVSDTGFIGVELIDLLEHFNALHKLKETKTLRIYSNQREVSPPIVWAVNIADHWPRNVFESLQKKYPGENPDELSDAAVTEYREMLWLALEGPNGL